MSFGAQMIRQITCRPTCGSESSHIRPGSSLALR
jgi:hypothetical protein